MIKRIKSNNKITDINNLSEKEIKDLVIKIANKLNLEIKSKDN